MSPGADGWRAKLPPGLAALEVLAMDLRWTWSHAGDELWKSIDRDAWERTENPYAILQSLGKDRLRELDQNAEFKARLNIPTRATCATSQRALCRGTIWRGCRVNWD